MVTNHGNLPLGLSLPLNLIILANGIMTDNGSLRKWVLHPHDNKWGIVTGHLDSNQLRNFVALSNAEGKGGRSQHVNVKNLPHTFIHASNVRYIALVMGRPTKSTSTVGLLLRELCIIIDNHNKLVNFLPSFMHFLFDRSSKTNLSTRTMR